MSSINRSEPGASVPRQRGAALVTAMLVVTLVSVVVSGLFWREHVTIRSVENRLALAQVNWVERVVLDWARVIVRLDGGMGPVDHLGETWAQGVPLTRLDETVTGGANIGDTGRSAALIGQMHDAQARLNLNNLLPDREKGLQTATLKAFQKLLDLNNFPTSLADAVRAYLLSSVNQTSTDGKVVAATKLPLLRVTDLVVVSGFDQSIVTALREQVVFLQKATPINLNTAGPLVIAAMIPDVSREAATRFCNRPRREFKSFQEALDAIQTGLTAPAPNSLSINTGYFLVSGTVRYDRVQSDTETLIRREGTKVTIEWQTRS